MANLNGFDANEVEPAVGFNPIPTGKYLAIYDIETDNINDITTAMANNFYKWKNQGRMSDLLSVLSNTFYRQMSVISK